MQTQAIYELIGTQAELNPESIALAAPGRTPLTYVELASQVRAVGRALHGLGIGRNDAVIVVLPHGPGIVTTCLGVAAYATALPLDPLTPTAAVQQAFTSLEPKAVFVGRGESSAAMDIAYALGIAVIEVESDRAYAGRVHPATASTDVRAVPLPAQANDDAFMLPTRGTDRHFAVVALTHEELCSSAHCLARKLDLTRRDKCLILTPLWKWHGSLADIVATLTSGGTNVCPPKFARALDFFEWVKETCPTWFTAEAAVHEAILDVANANPGLVKDSSFRFVQSSETDLSRDLQSGIEHTFQAPMIERSLGV